MLIFMVRNVGKSTILIFGSDKEEPQIKMIEPFFSQHQQLLQKKHGNSEMRMFHGLLP